MDWQPIATAPRGSETEVLLWIPGEAAAGGWVSVGYLKYSKTGVYWETERGYLFGKTWTRKNQPTHWMPMPDSP